MESVWSRRIGDRVTDSYDVDLQGSGVGWQGTFSNIIRYVADDLLSDGAPVAVALTIENYDGTFAEVSGLLIVSDASVLRLRTPGCGDQEFDIDDVRRLRV